MSKRSRLVYANDSYGPFSQSKNAKIDLNDPYVWLASMLKKRDGMIARAVKYKFKSRSNVPHVSNSSLEVSELRSIIEQLRCSNKKLTEENAHLKSKCEQLEVDLKSTHDLLSESRVICAAMQNDHKVLEDKLLDVTNAVTSIKAENESLVTKVNALNLQLSSNAGGKKKLSNLNTELNKLKNVNDTLKKCARKFEVQYKEATTDLAKCVAEKNDLIEHINLIEVSHMNDYNEISFKYHSLLETLKSIKASKDPPKV